MCDLIALNTTNTNPKKMCDMGRRQKEFALNISLHDMCFGSVYRK